MKRKCSICGSDNKEILYAQKYLLPGKRNLLAYDIVGCMKCGFIFADNIPSQKEYNRYYQNSSKYTYNSNVPKGLLSIYQDLHSITEKKIYQNTTFQSKKKYRILDIGCSIGTFLHMFKKSGFKHLIGIEPSRDCRRLAKDLYGIEVFPGTISTYRTDRKFDLIIMTGVLEHISDFTSILPRAVNFLNDGGMLMAAVPDAANFSLKPLSPFDEFSIEHINFFTRKSLGNLMKKYNLEMSFSESFFTPFYDSSVLVSLFRKTGAGQGLDHDHSGVSRMKKYIGACQKKLFQLDKTFERLIKTNESIVVWGVGSLTYRLLASTSLARVNISAFVDSNKSLQGKRLANKKINSPSFFDNYKQGTVFVASHIYGEEIENTLRNKYKFCDSVVRV